MIEPRRQLFRLGEHARQLLIDTPDDEFRETVKAMKEMDLWHLPYDKVDIEMGWQWLRVPPGNDPILGKEMYRELNTTVRFIGVTIDAEIENYAVIINARHPGGRKFLDETSDRMEWALEAVKPVVEWMVVLLATNNAEKHVQHYRRPHPKNPSHISRRYEYVTTISGRPTGGHGDGTGQPRCTHLRRGHIRRQHYGPGREFVKKVWIAPTIVNRDRGEPAPREAYNVSI